MEQALDPDQAAEAAAPAKKSKMPLILLLITVLLAGGGAAAWFFLIKKPAVEGEEEPVAVTKSYFFEMSPAFVVNLSEDELNRYLQVEVQLMVPDEAVIEPIEHYMPMIRNRLMLLFSTQRYDELSTRSGKEVLQQKALEEVRKVLTEAGEKGEVSGVYFTSLVMQ